MSDLGRISGTVLFAGATLALLPAFFSAMPVLESRFFPVVRDVELTHETRTPSGTSFYVAFRKVRGCEFQALVWYEGPVRLTVDFEPGASDQPRSRPNGDQYAGPWLARDLHGLKGSRAYAYHRCHPFWTTITPFYTG